MIMEWKRLTTIAISFSITILLLLLLPIISTNFLGSALNAEERHILSGQNPSRYVSKEEMEIIINEAKTFAEILFLYATMALEKPPDLRLCAYEMFRLKPNENSCRDKYSNWQSKEEVELNETELKGKFGGIGLEVHNKEGKVVVISSIDGTPAYRAGIKPDDIIIKVDNKPVLNLNDAVTRLRGKDGTLVEITVKRGESEILFNVVREVIIIHAVSTKVINNPSGAIGYVKIKIFSETMSEEFRKEITNLRNQGITKIILDFRNSPGGLLHGAFDVLSNFARKGYVSIVMRERNGETIFNSKKTGDFYDLKVVILINKGSASASEIVAGAMKDWGFPVVGTRSFGKGAGQTLIPLEGGSMLKITTFEFLVGNSKTKVNDIGVIPTHEVPDHVLPETGMPPEDKQLEKAIEILSK